MTKKELLEAIKDMPEDAEVSIYSGCLYRPLEYAKLQEVWSERKRIEVIALHPTPYAIKTK